MAGQEGVVQLRDGADEQGSCREIPQPSGPDMQGHHAQQAGLAGCVASGAALRRPQQPGHDVQPLGLGVMRLAIGISPRAEEVGLCGLAWHGCCVGQCDGIPDRHRTPHINA